MEVRGDSNARNRSRHQRARPNQMPLKSNWGKLSGMVDIDLIVQTLLQHGHTVEHVFSVPPNAGEYELVIDGNTLNLEEARALLEADEAK